MNTTRMYLFEALSKVPAIYLPQAALASLALPGVTESQPRL